MSDPPLIVWLIYFALSAMTNGITLLVPHRIKLYILANFVLDIAIIAYLVMG